MSYSENYKKYRGKCKVMSHALAEKSNGELTVVRGHYYEPLWDREDEHWWCIDKEGVIHDPTRMQYPSGGIAEFYTPFNGIFKCANCNTDVKESDVVSIGNYVTCSKKCAMELVGLYSE